MFAQSNKKLRFEGNTTFTGSEGVYINESCNLVIL